MITPSFSGERSFARDHDAGILIQVGGSQDLETVRIYFDDERRGAKFSFFGSYLWWGTDGKPTGHPDPGARLCGYEAMGRVGAYLTQSGLAIEDVRAYVIEGLRVIASNQMNIPKEEVVIQLTLAA